MGHAADELDPALLDLLEGLGEPVKLPRQFGQLVLPRFPEA